MKNWMVLAQAWFLSKYDDKAIVALREAAKLTDDGELDLRLARSLSNIGDYTGCIESANTGISKGSLKRLDESYITKGMCEFEAAEYEDAKESFAMAKVDADRRNDIALQQCADSENLSLDELILKMETQKPSLKWVKKLKRRLSDASSLRQLKQLRIGQILRKRSRKSDATANTNCCY